MAATRFQQSVPCLPYRWPSCKHISGPRGNPSVHNHQAFQCKTVLLSCSECKQVPGDYETELNHYNSWKLRNTCIHTRNVIPRRTDRRNNTGCPRRNVPDFGRVFLMLKYTDITQNTYVQSWTVTEIMASKAWNFDSCYTITDYQIHIKTGRNMLISVLNIKLTCEWHKTIKLNDKNTRTHVIVALRVPSTIHDTWMQSGDVTLLTAHSGIRTEMDKNVNWQVQCVDPQEGHTFLWPLSP